VLPAKSCNIHSDKMARIAHMMSYPGASPLLTVKRSSMNRETLDVTDLGTD
jgi:hypothetical protein